MDRNTRYYLIACGTSSYINLDSDAQLPSVEEDLQRVIKLFTEHFGYQRVLTDLYLNPKANDIKIKFATWLQDQERCETDIVLFYYSGHGEFAPGDKHYLLLETTEPEQMGQTALMTEDLVRPLQNGGVKISQILYIIDTCYSQLGALDIISFASQVIQQYQPIRGTNIDVQAIAACRTKQTAQVNIFSETLKQVLEDCCGANEVQKKHIHPSELVDKINRRIALLEQRVGYSNPWSETSPKFFPIIPKTIQTWDNKRYELVDLLLTILKEQLNDSLFFVNSFLLSSISSEFVLDELSLKEKLRRMSTKPVLNGICPLITCSEWCKLRFSERKNYELFLSIQDWQLQAFKHRKEANEGEIESCVESLNKKFKEILQREDLRIQIEIEPEVDEENNTGIKTGSFLMNINLWIQDQDLPLGKFAENILLKPLDNSLLICLQKEDLLSKLIRQTRFSLPEAVKPKIEFFLPFEFFQDSYEKICFQYGQTRKPLGKEYQIFINSFERYFDEDFREIRDEITKKKKALWNNSSELNSEFHYFGTEPSRSDLARIEETLPIAVWSRNADRPLVQDIDLKISEWQEWPQKIHDLRQEDREVTLFWDDLYPKPSERSRPRLLNTKMVE